MSAGSSHKNHKPFKESETPSIKAEVLKSISLSIEQFNSNFAQRNNWYLFSGADLQNPEFPKLVDNLPVVNPLKYTNAKLISDNLKLFNVANKTGILN